MSWADFGGHGKMTHEDGKVKCSAWTRNNENYLWKITIGNKIYISTEKHAKAHGPNPSKGCYGPTPVPVPEPRKKKKKISTVVNHQCSQERSLEKASTCVGDMSAGNGYVMAFVFGSQAQAEQGKCQYKKCGAGGKWVNFGDGKMTHEKGKVKCPAWTRNNENYIWKITLGNKIYISTEKHAKAHGTNPSKGCYGPTPVPVPEPR